MPVARAALVAKAIAGCERALTFGSGDFSANWNLGWARCMAGDWTGSLEATDAALADTPDRFTLYLNRALVQLAMGDPDQALATIEVGLDVAAEAKLGTFGTSLAQSDFEIGRLAELRPSEAQTLRAIRQRIREAEVSIATVGLARTPQPAGTLSVRSLVTLALQADGSMAAGRAIAEAESLSATGLSSLRLELAGDGPATGTVALRIRRDGIVDEGYSQVRTMPDAMLDAASTTFDLITPYGRAGFAMDPGCYEIEVYLDGHLAVSRHVTVTGS